MKNKKLLLISGALCILFIIYTIMVKYVDVAAIGPNNSEVGFQLLNKKFHEIFYYNDTWYIITKYLGIIPFLYVAFYGLQGLLQLIKYKSIKKIDKKLIFLGIFYVLMIAFYLLFEKVVINYRPVILEGELEASYPSSHTILGMCICLSSLLMNKYYIKNKKLLTTLNLATISLLIFLVGGRLLSGVHWFTDIIGGIILSLFLVCLLYSFIYNIPTKKNNKK